MTDEERQELLERAKQNLRDLEKFRQLFTYEEFEQRQDMFLKDVSRFKKKN